MRAPVQKMRPRRKGGRTASERGAVPAPSGPPGTPPRDPSGTSDPAPPAGSGVPTVPEPPDGGSPPGPPGKRRARVRNRLLISVTVVAAVVAGAGAPALLTSAGELREAQSLVTDAEHARRGSSLAHALAEERDEVIAFIAAGRPAGKGLSEQRSARVDRRVQELRPDAPAALRARLDAVAAARRAALTGKGSALKAHEAYAGVIAELHRLAEDVAERTPPSAAPGARALTDLDRAVEQASAARGLLVAALRVPRSTTTQINPVTGAVETVTEDTGADAAKRLELSTAGQLAHHRSRAALADFREVAPTADLASYEATVNGAEVTSAERHLGRLTDEAAFSAADAALDPAEVAAALASRVDLMRSAEASLAEARLARLERLRDDAVTDLEIRVALLGALLLVAVGVSMGTARSLTRPLAVLRLGSARLAADPAAEEPVSFTGRNDEFAQVVRSVNALHAHALALHERLVTLEDDRKHLIGERTTMADRTARLRTELAEAAAQLERVRHSIQGTFVNLALRTLGLVERQLAVIEGLEEREQDPDRLATLFRLDHFATVMRRHSENLLVLAGADHGHQHPGPVPLVDVARAAVSEIERYERVRITSLPPHAHIAGFAADDLSHLLAELMENATSFSPPETSVEVSGWLLENGEVMLSVQDEGIGMAAERLRELNVRLSEADARDRITGPEAEEGLGLGLYVVARLAHRHGVRVQLREQKQGGVTAVVVLPKGMLAAEPAAATALPPPVPRTTGAGTTLRLPGSEAEANANVLGSRADQGAPDPLITAAEDAVRRAGAAAERAMDGPSTHPEAPPGTGARPVEALAETTMELTLLPVPQPLGAHGFGGDPVGRAGRGPGHHARARDEAPGVTTAPDSPSTPARDARTAPAHTPSEPPAAHPVRPADGTTASAVQGDAPARTRLTDKGLPKRTPRISEPVTVAQPRGGGVDADALRRKLGGFHQGAAAGRRDVAAEIGGAPAGPSGGGGGTQGDTVEEGSS
ncbi:nitrate- and nitrite sensing domain-containing protein [Streptomyces sp. NPDC002490]|uniref:sensor histidine kinase n=1 Tax=Streptomyces sp. NPDC002490 TaxID=3154416 RepID=UPI00332AC294